MCTCVLKQSWLHVRYSCSPQVEGSQGKRLSSAYHPGSQLKRRLFIGNAIARECIAEFFGTFLLLVSYVSSNDGGTVWHTIFTHAPRFTFKTVVGCYMFWNLLRFARYIQLLTSAFLVCIRHSCLLCRESKQEIKVGHWQCPLITYTNVKLTVGIFGNLDRKSAILFTSKEIIYNLSMRISNNNGIHLWPTNNH